MEEIKISSWDEFPKKIDKIKNKYGVSSYGDDKQKQTILYRGQSDSEWKLQSTLERSSSKTWSIMGYKILVFSCKPQIETFTDHTWAINEDEVKKEIEENKGKYFIHIPCYEFLVYLRHHGFPSPLLDWTVSPYIAAFFAFSENVKSDRVAVFSYIKMQRVRKGGLQIDPRITVEGPYAKTHKRHFLQQSWYTICTKYDEKRKSDLFTSHEDVFSKQDKHQDILLKITIPRSERIKALTYLNEVNINAFSLFQTEEALMKTLWVKEGELKDID